MDPDAPTPKLKNVRTPDVDAATLHLRGWTRHLTDPAQRKAAFTTFSALSALLMYRNAVARAAEA